MSMHMHRLAEHPISTKSHVKAYLFYFWTVVMPTSNSKFVSFHRKLVGRCIYLNTKEMQHLLRC